MDFETRLAASADRLLEGAPPALAGSIRYSLFAPGKRIRPRLALAAGAMTGLEPSSAAAAAVALEMIHCFTLIHDDLPCMDDDDFRRGRPSNHKVHGEAMALLAGDALVPMAVEALAEAASRAGADAFRRALSLLLEAVGPRGVIGGQAAEIAGEASIQDIHALKTGALFRAAVLVPAALAGVGEGSPGERAAREFGEALGAAFQVADDLEDAGAESGASNILRTGGAGDAAAAAIRALDRAVEGLRAHWGSGADGPAAIASEVLERLRTHA